MIISIDTESPQKNLIKKVVEVLQDGGIIAYPTDTTYGIGCDIFNSRAVEKIFTLKGRDRDKPVSFVCADPESIRTYAVVGTAAYSVIKRCLPGPYTFILKAKENIPSVITGMQKTAGVRVPANTICTSIVRELSSPISSTSANISGEAALSSPQEIMEKIGGQLDLIIDGGVLISEPSSVVDLSKERPVVLRKGKGDVNRFF